MASRLDLLPVWLGHWRGLSMRTYRYDLPEDDDRSLVLEPDRPAQVLTILVPVLAAAVSGVLAWRQNGDWSLDNDVAGVAIAGASLLSAGMLTAFSLLASWRERLSSASLRRQRPLRAMIDEAVAHVLLAALESALLVGVSVLAMLLNGWLAKACAVLAAGYGAHVLFLFILLVPRMYSGYAQTADVEERLDGHSRI